MEMLLVLAIVGFDVAVRVNSQPDPYLSVHTVLIGDQPTQLYPLPRSLALIKNGFNFMLPYRTLNPKVGMV